MGCAAGVGRGGCAGAMGTVGRGPVLPAVPARFLPEETQVV